MKPLSLLSLFLIPVFALVVVGCQQSAPNPSPLDDTTCSPPCWENIVPGKSTEQDVLLMLPKVSNIDASSITSYNPKLVRPEGNPERIYDEIIHALFTSKGRQQNPIGIYVLGDVVSVLSFELRTDDLSLSEAIEKLGEPQYVFVAPYRENFIVGFVSPSTGTAFVYSTVGKSKRQRSEIYPEIRVGAFYFFDPETYEQFLEARFLSVGEWDAKYTSQHLVPWTGNYGDLSQYIKQP